MTSMLVMFREILLLFFTPRRHPRYHDTPYYIAPRDQVGQEAP
jgi:non-homologous end joining protein Ku